MHLKRFGGVSPLILALVGHCTSATPAQTHAPNNTISRDVVVVGGGPAGTYTAIRLQQEGKSVALIEREERLGGNTNTYVDPTTGKAFDIGVLVFYNNTLVQSFFNYLDIEWSGITFPQSEYADFARGNIIPTSKVAKYLGNTTEELAIWVKQLEKYPWLSNHTGYHFPDPIPDELFLPWGDYLQKYNMTGLATLYFYFNTLSNSLAQPTLYYMKEENLPNTLGTNIAQKDGNNQAIYDSALKKLGNSANVFLNSEPTRIRRDNGSVTADISSCNGQSTTIQASQIVMAIPPLPNSLDFLDLSLEETLLFDNFNSSWYWTTVALNTGAPRDVVIQNFDPQAALGVPAMPQPAMILPSNNIPNAHNLMTASPHYVSNELIQEQMLSNIERVQKAYNFSSPAGTKSELTFFHNHAPFFFTVSEEAIRGGFYDKVNKLQGQRRTFWTGAAFETENSARIWEFTENEILPALLRSLNGTS